MLGMAEMPAWITPKFIMAEVNGGGHLHRVKVVILVICVRTRQER